MGCVHGQNWESQCFCLYLNCSKGGDTGPCWEAFQDCLADNPNEPPPPPPPPTCEEICDSIDDEASCLLCAECWFGENSENPDPIRYELLASRCDDY